MAGTLTVQTLQGPSSGANANKLLIPSGQTLDVSGGTLVPSAGQVVQTVQGTYNTQISTTSTSYVTTNLTATITPTSSDSKVLIRVNTCAYAPTAVYNRMTLYRGSTDLATGHGGSTDSLQALNIGATSWIPTNIEWLDSPSTTSATTYTMYYKAASSTIYMHNGYTISTITLMEIAG